MWPAECPTLIVVVTPTYKRPSRLADMTRFAQTLMHVRNIEWVVVEDGNDTSPLVDRLLQRTGIPYTYFASPTKKPFPKRGWCQRNAALSFVRHRYRGMAGKAVVYFADDDNSYDIRLFDEYIRKVKTIGIWAVGLSGSAVVEAPKVVNGTIRGWNAVYRPERKFAVDMAGFAVNIQVLLHNNAKFTENCARMKVDPETCFLTHLKLPKELCQPFGDSGKGKPKEVLVWHTRTYVPKLAAVNYGYQTE